MPDNERPRPRLILGDDLPANPRADFVELGVTSAFSFLHGASQADELVLAAHAQGHDAIGIADQNSLAGVVRLHVAAKKARMRPVIGARIVLADGTGFLAYPTDRAAYGRLSTLISKGRMADLAGNWQAKGACDLSLDDLAAHAEGLQLIWLPGPDLSVLPGLAARLPGLRHVAASWLYRGDDRARINRLDRAARAAGLSIMATNDVHYHAPDRRPLQDIMTCIREKTTIARAGFLLHANAERHLKSPAQMAELFAEWPHAIRATREIADACAFSLEDLRYEYPNEAVPHGRTADAHLAALTWQGAARRYPEGVPGAVRATLEKELALIAKKKIAQYFLTINDIVGFARGEGILCQGRGSAANSAVCYMLGITPVDPSKFDLLFERFISEDRDEPPDIDVDFEHERREEVIQHIYDRYGRHRAGLCATVIHYRPRSAIREVGKAMGLSEDVTSALANTIWGNRGSSMGEGEADQAGLALDDPHLARTVRLAEQMIGMPRHLSQHVGGFILTEGPLTATVPIGNGAMADRSFIEWDKDDIDALQILKVDVLALGMLTCIRKCFDLIAAHHGQRWTLASVPQDDPETYDMLCRGDSVGVFQVESRAQMNMLPRLQPRVFYDLVIEVAIVRPGPIQGDMVHPYLRRRNGEEPEDYPSPAPPHDPNELRKILSRTKGVPIFQEQAMRIAMVAAQFNSREANELRKAMATFRSRGTIGALEEKMVERMIQRGYDPDFARRCFDQIKGFGEYGFPESHAAAFAHLVYVSSWLKRWYPAAFAAALLNAQPMGFYAPAQIVRDAREHGVTVLDADVNLSDWDNTLEPCAEGHDTTACAQHRQRPSSFALRLGLRQIDGLAEAPAHRIMAARDTPFASLDALKTAARLDSRSIRQIAAADACRSMGLDRRAALWDARALKDAPDLPLFRDRDEGEETPVNLPAMPLCEHVVADYQTLRLSLKSHPMRFLRASMTRQGYTAASDIASRGNGARLRMAGIVLIRQRPGSAKGVCFITLEDETGVANLVVWPKVFATFRKVVMTARLLDVTGYLQRDPKSGVTHLVATALADRTDALARLADDAMRPPLAHADEVARPIPAARQRHPRDVQIIPKSRDFH
ncbi:DNA polymerase III subunit alpha [Paracoccus sp. M683]|uniref:error-prone DNA polymerase n=1 Tax=Paracoccus sp. M683 TaxID=2594268 RepID=UPI00117E3BCB|nr:error-prone DNA polymerase [Paracoccus sp. M683]TRW99616.1 DNA polymerase III subunit alpha [Paracoccus sp. M683]